MFKTVSMVYIHNTKSSKYVSQIRVVIVGVRVDWDMGKYTCIWNLSFRYTEGQMQFYFYIFKSSLAPVLMK
jgi:hypothetical protein